MQRYFAAVHKSSSAATPAGATSRCPCPGTFPSGSGTDPRGPPGRLTERELEVVVLAARGLSNRRTAEELLISEATTVKRHLANVYQKVGARSRNEVVRKALVEEWIGLHGIPGDGSGDPVSQ